MPMPAPEASQQAYTCCVQAISDLRTASAQANNLQTWPEIVGVLNSAVEQALSALESATEALNPGARYWLVDEYNDWEGETFGFAIPMSPRADAVMEQWLRLIVKDSLATEGWYISRPPPDPATAPLEVLTEHSWNGMRWESGVTADALESIEEYSPNNYAARVTFLEDDKVAALLTAIETAIASGASSIYLYKGQLMVQHGDDRNNYKVVLDLWHPIQLQTDHVS